MIIDRPELLTLNPGDYLKFFEEATKIAREASFEGLLILADEVQQYIDPEVKTGVKDPISPLFDVISSLLTRRNHLNMGIILVLPPKELGVLREQRGDFIHRTLQASLDLRTIYDRAFPLRLWQRLAEEFDFTDHSHRIVTSTALEALGQICVRPDLSDGPRTVINTFRRMTRRYLELGHPADDPYTPYHLIEDFLMGQIEFDSAKKIQRVTNQALGHSLVKGYADRERAIKWAAAFPEEGISRELQAAHNLEKAFDDLMQSAQGDLVIAVGDIKKRGITLRGLDQIETDAGWLPTTIREFWRLYDENIEITQQRAIRGFFNLLTVKVFPDNQWKAIERIQVGLTRNNGLILEGSFTSYSRKYPERRLHVRVLWEDEMVKDVESSGEFLIQFRLKRYLDWTEAERRLYAEPLEINYEAHQINVTLNLMYRDEAGISPTLDKLVAPIVSPYKLTPLLMLSLYEVIDEKRANNAIPKSDDQTIQYAFQPDLLDNIFHLLFNAEVGRPVKAAQERVLEEASRMLLEVMYPEYETLMLVGNWANSLAKYRNALKHLETTHEKQGQVAFEGTKDDVAQLFTLSNTGLDTFISNFSALLLIQQPFPTQREISAGKTGAVRFSLHALEEKIKRWLADSPDRQNRKIGHQIHEVRSMPTNEVYRRAGELGYQYKEIEEMLDLMVERSLIVQDRRGTITEEVNQAPSIDDLAQEIGVWQKDIGALLEVFYQNQMLRSWVTDAQKFSDLVQNLRQKPDDEKAIMARRAVQAHRRQLDDFVKVRHEDFSKDVDRFLKGIPQPSPQHGRNLNNPIMGGVNYVEQINDLRSRLLRQFNALVGEADNYQQQVKSMAASFGVKDLEITTLVKLAQEYKTIQAKNEPLKEKCDTLAKDFERFNEWGRLVQLGSDLSDQIQELGDAVREERARFQKLSQDITGHLSANKISALPDAPTYENQMREIVEAVRLIKAEASNRFGNLQERYRQALTITLKFPRDRLWSPYPYNPANPDDSYRRLIQEVKNTLQNLHQQVSLKLAEFQNRVHRILEDPSLKMITLEEKDHVDIKGNSLLTELGQLSTLLSEIKVKLSDTTIVTDFPEIGEGKFHQLLVVFQPIPEKLAGVDREIKQIENIITIGAPEGEEKFVLDILQQSGSVEFSELRQKVSLPEEALWKALRGLYTKRRIRLPIEPIQYE